MIPRIGINKIQAIAGKMSMQFKGTNVRIKRETDNLKGMFATMLL